MATMAERVDRAFSMNTVNVVWRNNKWCPDKLADYELLKGLDCIRGQMGKFTDKQYDAVLAELGQHGWGISSTGHPDDVDEG